MIPSPDLARRLAEVAPVLIRLRRLSDRKLIAAGRKLTRTQADLAKQIGYSAVSLSRAVATTAKARRPLSTLIRERLATFVVLEGVDVPIPPRVPAGSSHDASEDRTSLRLRKSERTRLTWLGGQHALGLLGAVTEAFTEYLAGSPGAPPLWPQGVTRVPCPLPADLLDVMAALDEEPVVFARHARAAVVQWMERQPAGPPDARPVRQNALMAALTAEMVIGVAETSTITGANLPVSRQLLRRLTTEGLLEKVDSWHWRKAWVS